MTVKLEDIAKETGFSVPTVSRVLSRSDYPVSEQTRSVVIETARAMGYKPNISARSLRTSRSNLVGIIVDDLLSPFTPPIVRGIQDYLYEQDYQSLIVNSNWNPELEQEAIRTLNSQPVDGIIFVEYSHLAVSDLLEDSDKPHVFVHRLFGTPINNSVLPDDHFGASLATRHLIELGHQRIAYINGPENWHNSNQRYAGYKAELLSHGIEFRSDYITQGDWEFEGGYHAAQGLIHSKIRPTAIFAANDLMALGAIHAIQDQGLIVPEDIAVAGYDNRDFSRFVRPKITTVNMPVYQMGLKAAELMVNQMTDKDQVVDEIKIRGELIIRESCGADERMRAKEENRTDASFRRIVLNKQPEEPIFITREGD